MQEPVRKTSLHSAILRSQLSLVAQGRVVSSLSVIDPVSWNACFPGELENHDYLLAVEKASIPGFSWNYIVIEENGRVVAAMPIFLTDYKLDTTLDEGMLRRVILRIRKHFSRFLTMKLVCIGSPCTEAGIIGFHPSIDEPRKSELLTQLLASFEHYSIMEDIKLLGIKDIPENFSEKFGALFHEYGFSLLPGMPTAWLAIDFSSVDEYFNRLSSNMRKDMRRKMKSLDSIRIERRTNIDDLLPQVMALYHDTRARSAWQFEELTPEYFTGVLANMPEHSHCNLYYAGEKLLAANLLIHNQHTLIDKFFCMDGIEGRKYNLYFLSWFTNLNYCLEHGLGFYQSGQAYYNNKLRLGSRLTRNNMYFKHRNFLINTLLRFAVPLLGADETLEVPG